AEVGGVVALIAVDEVISVAPEQGVVAVAAEDGVVAGPAVNGKLDQRGQIAAGGEVVIAAIHVDDEVFAGTDIDAEGGRREAVEADAGAVGGGSKRFGAIAAIHFHSVNAVAALIEVGVVARIPNHAVIAALAKDLIVAISAGQDVVAGAAKQE